MKQTTITGTLAALILISTFFGCTTIPPDLQDIIKAPIRAPPEIAQPDECDNFEELFDKYSLDSRYYAKAHDLLNRCCNRTNPSGHEPGPSDNLTVSAPPLGYMYLFVTGRDASQWLCTVKDPDYHPETIKIASWNIQVFGQTKAAKPDVMSVIAQTIAQFDIVAIQEIRDKSGTAIKELERQVDALGTDYAVIIGPRLGRTSSKEQYAYIYNTETVESFFDHPTDDPEDLFHREPHYAHFTSKQQNFGFDAILVNIHVDPDEADREIEALADVPKQIGAIWDRIQPEEDYIILGDMNSDCSYWNEWSVGHPLRDPVEFKWLIGNEMDTNLAVSSCTYDRIITTDDTLEDWTGTAGVYRFDTIHGLTNEEAKQVSDHYPVYAELYIDKDRD